jgi:hypothetical protein
MKIDKKLFRDGPYSDFFSQGVQAGSVLLLPVNLEMGETEKFLKALKSKWKIVM